MAVAAQAVRFSRI